MKLTHGSTHSFGGRRPGRRPGLPGCLGVWLGGRLRLGRALLEPVLLTSGSGARWEGVPLVTFGALLRKLRVDAGLTQEELAAAAGLSVRSVSDLERGVALTARKETARLLA